MLVELKENFKNKEEIYLQIKANPGASKTEIKEIMDDKTIKVNIRAIAEKGKANLELIGFLAKYFGVKKENIKIINGKKSGLKLIKIFK